MRFQNHGRLRQKHAIAPQACATIDDANHRYHVLDEPAITDAEYDG